MLKGEPSFRATLKLANLLLRLHCSPILPLCNLVSFPSPTGVGPESTSKRENFLYANLYLRIFFLGNWSIKILQSLWVPGLIQAQFQVLCICQQYFSSCKFHGFLSLFRCQLTFEVKESFPDCLLCCGLQSGSLSFTFLCLIPYKKFGTLSSYLAYSFVSFILYLSIIECVFHGDNKLLSLVYPQCHNSFCHTVSSQ